MEEQVGRVLVEGDVADFVYDEQLVAAQIGLFLGPASAGVGFGQS